MTRAEITLESFLKSGAFLRDFQGHLHVWQGPWKGAPSHKEASILQMEFYSGLIQMKTASKTQLNVSIPDFRKQLHHFFQPSKKEFEPRLLEQPSLTQFESAFQLIQGKIARGEIEKAVPTVVAKAESTLSEHDICGMLLQVLEAPSEFICYGFWDEGTGILGASPELLFPLSEKTLKTAAIAGTCPKADLEKRQPLLKDKKELKEHMYVIEDLIQKLGRYGHVQRQNTKVIDLGTLLHLKTDLQVEGNNWDVPELLKKLHPTAALGVWPQNYGIQWMKALPYQEERFYFGSPLTFQIGPHQAESVVAIRNLEWDSTSVRVASGCGIVEGSELMREWNELNAKRTATSKLLGLQAANGLS